MSSHRSDGQEAIDGLLPYPSALVPHAASDGRKRPPRRGGPAAGANELPIERAMAQDDIQLQLDNISKSYRRADGRAVRAVNEVSISIRKGEFLVLLGASGCGKTTLLRCVAGLEQPDNGRMAIGGREVFNSASGVEIAPERRRIGMVFQSYALWPHMTVVENVAYPLRRRGVPKAEAGEKAMRILEMMRIAELGRQHPGQISGGQQQRVALSRALVCGDDLILFDEPLSNVDAKVREHLRLELMSMQRDLAFTGLYVTHDQEEAMALATRIAVVADGRIAQLGTPQEIYRRPQSLYVGRFIGSANQFDGTLERTSVGGVVDTALGKIALTSRSITATGRNVAVLSRPERWILDDEKSDGGLGWPGRILASAFVGSHNEYLVDVAGLRIQVWQLGASVLAPGTEVFCSIEPDAFVVLDRE